MATPDVVVALRFPAYLVRHPDKRALVQHQLRQYYEHFELTCRAGDRGEHVVGLGEARDLAGALRADGELRRRSAERLAQLRGGVDVLPDGLQHQTDGPLQRVVGGEHGGWVGYRDLAGLEGDELDDRRDQSEQGALKLKARRKEGSAWVGGEVNQDTAGVGVRR